MCTHNSQRILYVYRIVLYSTFNINRSVSSRYFKSSHMVDNILIKITYEREREREKHQQLLDK